MENRWSPLSLQARIQEFSPEGVQLSEILDKQKKKEKKKGGGGGGQKTEETTEGCGGSSPSVDLIDFPDVYLHTSFFFGRAWSFVQLQAPLYTKHKDGKVVLYCKCVREGG